jgi:hypothetical protein
MASVVELAGFGRRQRSGCSRRYGCNRHRRAFSL